MEYLKRHLGRIFVQRRSVQHTIVIAAGGGGIPAVYEAGADRKLVGIECVIDKDLATELLAQRMLDDHYLIAPGSLFYASRQPSTLMRINYACTQDAAFWGAYQRVRAGMANAADWVGQ